MSTHFIDGEWVEGTGGAFASRNPATGEVIWEGRAAGPKEVDRAYAAARKAFHEWMMAPFEKRVEIARAFSKLVEQNKEALVVALGRDNGKIMWDARNEITAMAAKTELAVSAYLERTGYKQGEGPGFKTQLIHKPHGVCAVFGPYNFPAHLPNGHIVPALIAGNTIVYKPSEHTPFVSEMIVKLWQQVLPKGVLNLVQGERETGKLVSGNLELDGLFFTGSSETGKILGRQFADTPHKVLALELGGNAPLVVWEVKDKKAAAYGIIQSAFMSTGQRCTCARRLILPMGKEGDEVLDILIAMTKTLKVGAFDAKPEPYMGPIIAMSEADKLMAAQESLISNGAKALLPMERLAPGLPFLSAGILDVTECEARPDKEYFGPLLQVIRVKDFEAAIKEANHTRYGLASGIFSDSRELFQTFLREVRAGVVNWNRPTTGNFGTLPFSGVGLSGNHRPAGYYAADYCAWPVATNYNETISLPQAVTPGISV